jgi:signal transduction histidine kinase
MIVVRPLVERRTYRDLLFLLSGTALAGVWLALLVAGYVAACVLAVTPLLVPVLIAFRVLVWSGARVETALARELLDVDVGVGALRAGGRGYFGRIRGILGDGAFWREQVYLFVRMTLGFATGVAAAAATAGSLAMVAMPAWYWSLHPYVATWRIYTLREALACVPIGLVGVVLSVWLVRGIAAMWRRLAGALLGAGGDAAPTTSAAVAFRRGLAYHAGLFAFLNAVPIVVWALTRHATFWPEWTLLPLGMLLAGHAWIAVVLERLRRPALAIHLGLAALLELFLVAIWAVTTRAYFWPMWPALALGIVAAVHAIVAQPWRERAELVERIGVLTATRAGAVDVTEWELRRIERDLHDGAQARLVALGMSLGMAEQKLADDPEGARRLLEEARAGAEEALTELRDLVRGIHPPVLADRGLEAALAALVGRSPFPVALEVELAERPPATVETAAYFVAAEALANASKHATAECVSVWIGRRHGALVVRVEDDGRGDADASGGGLNGIRRRVEALDGTLSVSSPTGGPTIVEAVMPCAQ